MNFDGKAFVKNTTNRTFISHHGYSTVRDIRPNHINNFCLTSGYDNAYVNPVYMTNENVIKPVVIHNRSGLIPHSVCVCEDRYQPLKSQTFILIRDDKSHDIQDDFEYEAKRVYVSRLQPTNIKYNPKSAIVIDSTQRESAMAFSGVTVNVNSKIEVVIPEKGTDYSDISIVVQKNSFIELKISDSVTDVVNLPDDLMYLPGYIKGTFTKSGEYNIKIKYPDGEQILNIIVPYYQRLL